MIKPTQVVSGFVIGALVAIQAAGVLPCHDGPGEACCCHSSQPVAGCELACHERAPGFELAAVAAPRAEAAALPGLLADGGAAEGPGEPSCHAASALRTEDPAREHPLLRRYLLHCTFRV